MHLKVRQFLGLFLFSSILLSCSSNKNILSDSSFEPKIENKTFYTRDGTKLHVYLWGTMKSPEKIIIASHSFGDYGKAYELIGNFFAKKNISLWTYDQRGFGDSPLPGIWSGKENMINDFKDFTKAILNISNENIPIILAGESMGAAVILAALSSGWDMKKPESLILSGPGIRENNPHRYLLNFALYVSNKIIPGYEGVLERSYDNSLTDFHAKRWYKDYRIIHKVRLDTYFGLIRLSDFASNNARDYGIPSLILFGTNDTQIHPNSICALMKRLGKNANLKVYHDKPHLVLQMKDQKIILDLIYRWVSNSKDINLFDNNSFCK